MSRKKISFFLLSILFIVMVIIGGTNAIIKVFASPIQYKNVKVGTYNIFSCGQHIFIEGEAKCEGIKENQREIELVDVIWRNNVEILGMQEVDNDTIRSDKRDIAESISKKVFPIDNHFNSNVEPKDEGYLGNAIISKYLITDAETVQLPVVEFAENRVFQKATISLDENIDIGFYNIHTTPDIYDGTAVLEDKSNIRAEQLKMLLKDVEGNPLIYKVIVGDFNLRGENADKELAMFVNEGYQVVKNENGEYFPTFPTNKKIEAQRAVDYIIVSKEVILRQEASNTDGNGVITDLKGTMEIGPSDHQMLFATIAIPDDEEDTSIKKLIENDITYYIRKNNELAFAEKRLDEKTILRYEFHTHTLYDGEQLQHIKKEKKIRNDI